MTHRLPCAIVLLLPLGLLACAAAAPRAARIHDLRGSWQFDGAVPVGARVPTMTIDFDGSVQGNSGVNRFRTTLNLGALADGRWQTEPAALTRMAGSAEAMALEAAFLQALAQADAVEIAGEGMQLLDGDVVIARFLRPTLPPRRE